MKQLVFAPLSSWRLVVLALIVAAAVPGAAQGPQQAGSGSPERKGTVERVTVPGASLAGNLEKDPADRDVFIYLPPGYASSKTTRYPVVYLLHGYGLTAERWMTFANVAAGADRGVERRVGETPLELAPRLDEMFRATTPARITSAFDDARYGGVSPPQEEVAQLMDEWKRLRETRQI